MLRKAGGHLVPKLNSDWARFKLWHLLRCAGVLNQESRKVVGAFRHLGVES